MTRRISRARRTYRWLRKRAKRASSYGWLAVAAVRNRWSTSSVLGSADVVVSLTTYGPRVNTVAHTIESIGVGKQRPRRLILWMDDPLSLEQLPAALRRLQRRGLEVTPCPDYGPHKKYYPTLDLAVAVGLPLVTADDDTFYPRSWLSKLLRAAASHPDVVSCYRASVIAVTDFAIAPYATWPRCQDDRPSTSTFATGVSGVYYPLPMLNALRSHDKEFMNRCPRADDIWLHWVALQSGIQVRQIDKKPRHFPYVPGSQTVSLVLENVHQGMNDQRIAKLYSSRDRATLIAAGAVLHTDTD